MTTSPVSAVGQIVMRVEGLRTHLTTKAGIVKAVDGVDLDVRSGETLGIVGESGSGKSMTALSIMGLLPQPAGRIVGGHIWFEGEDLVAKSQEAMSKIRGRKIAMIPQDPMTSLNPVYTIGNQIEESIRLAQGRGSKTSARHSAVDLLSAVSIADPLRQLRSYPHRLSGGMRQRVVGAIAMAGALTVLIADEPTTSLDATVQLQYLEVLKRIQRDTGAAIIMITHDFGVVAKICDKVAVMYAGKVVESGPVREVFNNSSHPYTQALISSVPKIDEDVDLLATIAGQPPDPLAMPPGCSFAPRCSHSFARCLESFPARFDLSAEHSASCWLLESLT
jgi:oligopeptide/dipeptide ABC transporter ATP-binding protein